MFKSFIGNSETLCGRIRKAESEMSCHSCLVERRTRAKMSLLLVHYRIYFMGWEGAVLSDFGADFHSRFFSSQVQPPNLE